MKTLLSAAAILLLACYSCATQAQSPDYNLDFEYWDSATMTNDSANFAAYPWMHQVADPYTGKLLYGWHAATHYWRTTDAYSGQYALVLNQWYNGGKEWLLMGDCANPTSNDSCRVAIPQRIYGLSGYYKFYPDSNAVGTPKLTIITYKLDSVTQVLGAITKDTLVFASAPAYTWFNMPVSYTGVQPDSMAVRFDITGPFTTNIYSNFLYLDSLQFHYQPYNAAAVGMQENDNGWKIFPNPAGNVLYIASDVSQTVHIGLYNADGKKLKEITWPRSAQFDLKHLPDGLYSIKICDEKQGLQLSKKIIVQH